MKATGIVNRIDDLGRIAIPKDIRRNLGIEAGDELEAFIDDGVVIFKKYLKETSIKEGVILQSRGDEE